MSNNTESIYKFQSYKQRQGHDIGGVRPVMIPNDDGDWVGRHDTEHLADMLKVANKRIIELEAGRFVVELTIESLPKDEGFWSAIYDIFYQAERKDNWNVQLSHSDSKKLAKWLSEVLPLRSAVQEDK